jgi:hypothetical protein
MQDMARRLTIGAVAPSPKNARRLHGRRQREALLAQETALRSSVRRGNGSQDVLPKLWHMGEP